MRSIWKGSIGFGLVNIPIKLYSAVQKSNLDFDMLDSKDHSRIKFQRINENSRKEVPYDKIVKGYMIDEKYVILDDKDFEDASPEKTFITKHHIMPNQRHRAKKHMPCCLKH
jgi:DNA end-binding protein Ku